MPLEMTAAPSADIQTKGSVLVVDDELDIREGLDMLLTSAGYAVDLAQNGIEGIQKMGARGYSTS
jgi:CheY-like chemotaxis protein